MLADLQTLSFTSLSAGFSCNRDPTTGFQTGVVSMIAFAFSGDLSATSPARYAPRDLEIFATNNFKSEL
jgi:hypothetical protein